MENNKNNDSTTPKSLVEALNAYKGVDFAEMYKEFLTPMVDENGESFIAFDLDAFKKNPNLKNGVDSFKDVVNEIYKERKRKKEQ